MPKQTITELAPALQSYIHLGEQQNAHQGYKCRIRDYWYSVPSIWRPDAFMLRQVHAYPKLILNQTDATCTDTIHRVRFISLLPPELITAAFLNSLTFAFSEILGRSYGGGVLELEPNEAEALLLPLQNAETLDIVAIQLLMLEGNIEAVLDLTDRVLLIDGMGLSIQEVECLRSAWTRLRDRRIHRKHKKSLSIG